jgi:hypothetical protein
MRESLNPFDPPKALKNRADSRLLLIPYERFDFLSDLPPGDVLEELEEAIEPFRWFRFFWSSRKAPFEGRVTGSSFACQRIVTTRNGFVPRVRGVVEPHARGGSRIRGSMTLKPQIALMLVVWIFAVLLGAYRFATDPARETRSVSSVLVMLGMLLFFWIIAIYSFRSETRKARNFLVDRLDARPALTNEVGFE